MVIGDKQELRRCVKQLVRHMDVAEASLDFDVLSGSLGIAAVLEAWASPAGTPGEVLERACAGSTPVAGDAVAMFAALDALNLPVHDLDKAQSIQRSYDRNAYLREILDVMHARRVLVRVPSRHAGQAVFEDDRFAPLIVAQSDLFKPGRYGVDYAGAARTLTEALAVAQAGNVALDHCDAQALRYCMMPLCEETGAVLHARLDSAEEIAAFVRLIDEFDGVRALACAAPAYEGMLMDAAAARPRILVRLTDPGHVEAAAERLGTRFVPYASEAKLPELMLGRWIDAREKLWQALCQVYLPLARTGYDLRSDAVETDIGRLMYGNLCEFCGL